MNYEQQLGLITAAKQLASDHERASGLYEQWLEYNFQIFDGQLEPLIIMLAETSTYGSQDGHYSPCRRKIFIWDKYSPKQRAETLLHEMAHQYVSEIVGWRPVTLPAGIKSPINAHNVIEWCDVWNDIILPATGYSQFCVPLRKRGKRTNPDTGTRENVKQLIWVPSCGDRTPLPYDVISCIGHPDHYVPAEEPWATNCEPGNHKGYQAFQAAQHKSLQKKLEAANLLLSL